jgi:23S rRNA-/tRNA-specific pseudouridylate synthase
VTIVQQDISTGLIALNKPSGMLSHPNDSSSPQQLFNSSARSSSSSSSTTTTTRKSHHTLIRGTYHYKDEYYLIRINSDDEINSNKSRIDEQSSHHLSMNNNNNHISGASAGGTDTTVYTGNFMKVWLLHRLDSATSGVILVSINPYVAQSIKEQFELQKVYKLYVSVVIDESKLSTHEMRATIATADGQNDKSCSRRSRSRRDLLSTTKNKRKQQQQQLLFEWEDSISINKSHNTIRVMQYHHHDHHHNSFNNFSNTSYKVARTKAYFYNASNNKKTVHNKYPNNIIHDSRSILRDNNQYSNLYIVNPNCNQASSRNNISSLSSSLSSSSSSQSPPSSSSLSQSQSSSSLLLHPCLRLMFYEPHTGYSHQLRVQSAHHGYPILGDRTYGNFKVNKMILKLIHNMKHDQKNVVMKQSSSNHKSEVIIDSSTYVTQNDNQMIYHHEDNDGKLNQKSIIKIINSISSEDSSKNRLFLHSHKVEVSYQFAGRIHQFKALSPIPSIFSAII